MSRQYPNISMRLKELVAVHDINDARLSQKTDINNTVIKKYLKGEKLELCFRNLIILSKEFGMRISDFIDYVSQKNMQSPYLVVLDIFRNEFFILMQRCSDEDGLFIFLQQERTRR